MDKYSVEKPLGPLTLEEAERWLLWLENIVTIERDAGFAYSFVLQNLFGLLARSQLIDGHAFIALLRQKVPQIEGANYRIATDCVLDDLMRSLQTAKEELADKGLH